MKPLPAYNSTHNNSLHMKAQTLSSIHKNQVKWLINSVMHSFYSVLIKGVGVRGRRGSSEFPTWKSDSKGRFWWCSRPWTQNNPTSGVQWNTLLLSAPERGRSISNFLTFLCTPTMISRTLEVPALYLGSYNYTFVSTLGIAKLLFPLATTLPAKLHYQSPGSSAIFSKMVQGLLTKRHFFQSSWTLHRLELDTSAMLVHKGVSSWKKHAGLKPHLTEWCP